MRYCIELIANFGGGNVTAWGKARADVSRTFSEAGLQPRKMWYHKFNIPFTKKKVPVVSAAVLATQIPLLRFKKDDIVFVQYPFPLSCVRLLTNRVKSCEAKLYFLIHDVNSVRWNMRSEQEVGLFNDADILYVHTEAMADILQKFGVKTQMTVFHLFDYYSLDAMIPTKTAEKLKFNIAIAGNLQKSEYLPLLFKSKVPNRFAYELYGLKGDLSIENTEHFRYHGIFQANHTGNIKAGWGLVWDGNSIDSCTGVLGEYLRYNSSHKLSLYLTCGIPVIVWKESCIGQWLEKKGCALTVASLDEIYDRIESLSNSEYQEMVNNASRIGEQLRMGGFLKSVL